jgi:tetratricopeptide (TPR) repeat protein
MIRRSICSPSRALASGAFALLAACGPASKYAPPVMTPQEVEWERYRALEEAGDIDRAAAGYRRMCVADPAYVRACYDLSRALDEAGRKDEAIAEARAFIAGHPGHGLAPSAAERVARAYGDLGRPDDGVADLEALAAAVRGTDVWDSIVWEVARIHRGRGDIDREAEALDRVRREGRWGSQLWDNAIWRLIEISALQGRRDDEKRLLAELIGTMEESHLIASYNSPYHGKAILRLGRICFEDGELDRARGLFMDLAAWDTSRLKDDGYLWAAKVDLRRGETGRACRLLRKILGMPAASSRREARDLAGAAGCPGEGDQ